MLLVNPTQLLLKKIQNDKPQSYGGINHQPDIAEYFGAFYQRDELIKFVPFLNSSPVDYPDELLGDPARNTRERLPD